MGNVRRVYVEKKKDYAVKAKELLEELRQYLGLSIDDLRILIRYDIEDLSDESYQKALGTVFSEPPVDEVYEEEFPKAEDEVSFSVEYLPGQFDQRADSAEQCVKLLNEEENAIIRSATTYVVKGSLSEDQMKDIKEYCINPDHQSRLDVLMRYKDTVSEIMLDSMSLSMDCVLNGQSREEKYNELEKILKTKVHYEKKPR